MANDMNFKELTPRTVLSSVTADRQGTNLRDYVEDDLIPIYVYEKIDVKSKYIDIGQQTITYVQIAPVVIKHKTVNDVTSVEQIPMYVLGEVTSEGSLQPVDKTNFSSSKFINMDSWHIITNDYKKELNDKPKLYTIGAPYDYDKYMIGDQAIYTARILPTGGFSFDEYAAVVNESILADSYDMTEIEFTNAIALERQENNARIIYLLNATTYDNPEVEVYYGKLPVSYLPLSNRLDSVFSNNDFMFQNSGLTNWDIYLDADPANGRYTSGAYYRQRKDVNGNPIFTAHNEGFFIPFGFNTNHNIELKPYPNNVNETPIEAYIKDEIEKLDKMYLENTVNPKVRTYTVPGDALKPVDTHVGDYRKYVVGPYYYILRRFDYAIQSDNTTTIFDSAAAAPNPQRAIAYGTIMDMLFETINNGNFIKGMYLNLAWTAPKYSSQGDIDKSNAMLIKAVANSNTFDLLWQMVQLNEQPRYDKNHNIIIKPVACGRFNNITTQCTNEGINKKYYDHTYGRDTDYRLSDWMTTTLPADLIAESTDEQLKKYNFINTILGIVKSAILNLINDYGGEPLRNLYFENIDKHTYTISTTSMVKNTQFKYLLNQYDTFSKYDATKFNITQLNSTNSITSRLASHNCPPTLAVCNIDAFEILPTPATGTHPNYAQIGFNNPQGEYVKITDYNIFNGFGAIREHTNQKVFYKPEDINPSLETVDSTELLKLPLNDTFIYAKLIPLQGDIQIVPIDVSKPDTVITIPYPKYPTIYTNKDNPDEIISAVFSTVRRISRAQFMSRRDTSTKDPFQKMLLKPGFMVGTSSKALIGNINAHAMEDVDLNSPNDSGIKVDLSLETSNNMAPLLIKILDTQDGRVEFQVPWFDPNLVMPLYKLQNGMNLHALCKLPGATTTISGLEETLLRMILVTIGAKSNWKQIFLDDNGEIPKTTTVGLHKNDPGAHTATSLKSANALQLNDATFEKWKIDNSIEPSSPALTQAKSIIALLSRYIISSEAVGGGGDSFNAAMLPYYLEIIPSLSITTISNGSKDFTYWLKVADTSYLDSATGSYNAITTATDDPYGNTAFAIKFRLMSEYYNIGNRLIKPELLGQKLINMSNLQTVNADMEMILPKLPDVLGEQAPLLTLGNLKYGDNSALQNIVYFPVADSQILNILFLREKSVSLISNQQQVKKTIQVSLPDTYMEDLTLRKYRDGTSKQEITDKFAQEVINLVKAQFGYKIKKSDIKNFGTVLKVETPKQFYQVAGEEERDNYPDWLKTATGLNNSQLSNNIQGMYYNDQYAYINPNDKHVDSSANPHYSVLKNLVLATDAEAQEWFKPSNYNLNISRTNPWTSSGIYSEYDMNIANGYKPGDQHCEEVEQYGTATTGTATICTDLNWNPPVKLGRGSLDDIVIDNFADNNHIGSNYEIVGSSYRWWSIQFQYHFVKYRYVDIEVSFIPDIFEMNESTRPTLYNQASWFRMLTNLNIESKVFDDIYNYITVYADDQIDYLLDVGIKGFLLDKIRIIINNHVMDIPSLNRENPLIAFQKILLP